MVPSMVLGNRGLRYTLDKPEEVHITYDRLLALSASWATMVR